MFENRYRDTLSAVNAKSFKSIIQGKPEKKIILL